MSAPPDAILHEREVARGERFRFGRNWRRFLRLLNESRVQEAEAALKRMLAAEDLRSRTFLDIGSGSGLTSLAARRLGAMVVSFDYDPHSFACTMELRRRFFRDDADWRVMRGSVLDESFMAGLGLFDVVCSWGVLHHTGAMWRALENASLRVAPGGDLFVAIYNDQGFRSRYWHAVKRLYNRDPVTRLLIILLHLPTVYLARVVVRLLKKPTAERGMSLWYDMLDWLGGYPFEVARPEAVIEYLQSRGFTLRKLRTCGGRYGCNEFVFRKTAAAAPA